LLDAHVIKEAVARFCQGCHDKKAAKHAGLENPRTIQEAMSAVKHHQYVISTVDADSKPKRKPRDEYSVNEVSVSLRQDIEKCVGEALAKALSSEMVAQAVSSKSAGPPANPRLKSSLQCLFCKNWGHVKAECRKFESWRKSKGIKMGDYKKPLNG